MTLTRIAVVLLFEITLGLTGAAQVAKCADVSAEPHHSLLYSSSDVRIFRLDLARLQATDESCHKYAYLRIIVTDGRTADIVSGGATMSRNWEPGSTRFIYTPKPKVTRNETGGAHREYVIEMLHGVEYNPLHGNYDTDVLPPGLGSVKPTWTVEIVRGAPSVANTQLAPADSVAIRPPSHFLVALTDVDLTTDSGERIRLPAGDAQLLKAASTASLRNAGTARARFIIVEF
jgi:hypothetical protein